MNNIEERILQYRKQLFEDKHDRYRSWEHCYLYFQDYLSSPSEARIDTAALQLSFYLASWGMYRASSFLSKKDYKVHIQIVREVSDKRYYNLQHLDCDSLHGASAEVGLVFELASRLKQIYQEVITVVDGKPKRVEPSDILITKILLGTLCCTPAYDKYFTAGVKTVGISDRFSPESYVGLIGFFKRNSDAFRSAQVKIEQRGMDYPVMRLIDMYFWNIGYQAEKREPRA